jgi:transcriptional regulator with XRE-family HTH domain
MGHTAEKPRRLPEKLLQVRESLGLTQGDLVSYLGLEGKLSQGKISEFETGRREPSLLILLKYARAVRVPMDILVDDELDLPRKLTRRS